MKRILCMLLFLIAGNCQLQAQYISRSEPLPYVCPVVCQGGTTILRIFQVQGIPNGQQIEAFLSNGSGSFGSGTQVLEADRYSTNGGSTWFNGPYIVSGNVSELLLEITIPPATPPGNAYKVKIRSSGGYISTEVYQCPGTGITVTPFVAPLLPVAETAQGVGQWIGHVYTWTPTFGGLLNTIGLVNAQNFFSPANYKGHVLYDNLSFDIDLSGNGGVPGTWNQGTSMGCGDAYQQNYSMRMLRRETFSPGVYRFEIWGDDGIRLSIDGGTTWLLSSFLEQTYASSHQTSDVNFPNGVCLSGPTDLLIEYFQRPADARITFSVTPIAGGTNPPAIIQPLDQTVCQGDAATFSTGPALSGFTYQWLLSTDGGGAYNPLSDGGIYTGTQAAALNISATATNMNNYRYRCTVSGNCGSSLDSDEAILLVKSDALITTQPQSQPVCIGSPVQFDVAANGNSGFQWQINTGTGFSNLSGGSNYSGTGSDNLQIVAASYPAGTVSFRCLITGGCQGDIFSNVAVLTIQSGPSIIVQPSDFSGCANLNASLSVQTSGTVTGRQWQISTDNGNTFSNVTAAAPYSGVTGNQLTITPSGAAPSGALYRCLITGSCGNIPSGTARMNTDPLPSITVHPVDQPYCEGENITFTIAAIGTISSYQWQLSIDAGDTYNNISSGAPYSGPQTAILTINPAIAAFTGNAYRCQVNGCNETAFTNKAFVQVSSAAAIDQEPDDLAFCEGEPGSIQVTASRAAAYQWQRKVPTGFVNLVDNSNYSGVQDPSLHFTGNEGGVYRCLVSGGCTNNLPSREVSVTITPFLQVVSQPEDVTTCITQEAGFSISSSGEQVLYRWEYSADNGVAWQDVPTGNPYLGEIGPALKILQVSAQMDNYRYRCRLEAPCGGIQYSSSALLKLDTQPEILRSPINQQICAGNSVTFSSDLNLNTGITWEYSSNNGTTFNPVPLGGIYSGTHEQILRINPVDAGMNNWQFRVRLNACEKDVVSTSVQLLVNTLPVLIGTTSPPPVCPGEGANFSIQSEGADTFSWEINSGEAYEPLSDQPWLTGSGTPAISINPVPDWNKLIKLRALLRNGCGTTEAGPFNLEVKAVPEIIAQPSVSGGCSEPQLQVNIGIKGNNPELQWEWLDTLSGTYTMVPEGEPFSGSRNSTLQLSHVDEMEGRIFRCRISGCSTDIVSDSVIIRGLQNFPVYIPNSFSPNGDQVNPEFRIYAQEDAQLDLSIYSRWGDLVFHTNKLNEGWDGTFMGHLLPDGVYFYRMNLSQPCGNTKKTGTLHLVR